MSAQFSTISKYISLLDSDHLNTTDYGIQIENSRFFLLRLLKWRILPFDHKATLLIGVRLILQQRQLCLPPIEQTHKETRRLEVQKVNKVQEYSGRAKSRDGNRIREIIDLGLNIIYVNMGIFKIQ
jgi:hypothetical protein